MTSNIFFCSYVAHVRLNSSSILYWAVNNVIKCVMSYSWCFPHLKFQPAKNVTRFNSCKKKKNKRYLYFIKLSLTICIIKLRHSDTKDTPSLFYLNDHAIYYLATRVTGIVVSIIRKFGLRIFIRLAFIVVEHTSRSEQNPT